MLFYTWQYKDQLLGPFTHQELLQRLETNQTTWGDFVFEKSQGQWVRACEHEKLKSYQSLPPEFGIDSEDGSNQIGDSPAHVYNEKTLSGTFSNSAITKPKFEADVNQWYLQTVESELGPLSAREIALAVKSGQFSGDIFAWKPGLQAWKNIFEIPDLKPLLEHIQNLRKHNNKESTENSRSTENTNSSGSPSQRKAERKTFLAGIDAYDQTTKKLHSYICKDISTSGMFLLNKRSLLPIGCELVLNVKPMVGKIKPFKVNAIVRRATELGIGVEFVNVNEAAQEILESVAKKK